MYKNPVNNGIFTISTGDSRISEPPTASGTILGILWCLNPQVDLIGIHPRKPPAER